MATLTAHPHRIRHPQRGLFDQVEERPRPPRPAPRPPAVREPAPSRPTLDDLVAGSWDALQVAHTTACLVCGVDLRPRFSSGPHPVGASCGNCGSQLS